LTPRNEISSLIPKPVRGISGWFLMSSPIDLKAKYRLNLFRPFGRGQLFTPSCVPNHRQAKSAGRKIAVRAKHIRGKNVHVPDELGTYYEPEVTAMAAEDTKNTKSTKKTEATDEKSVIQDQVLGRHQAKPGRNLEDRGRLVREPWQKLATNLPDMPKLALGRTSLPKARATLVRSVFSILPRS